jgi:protoporphyrinogen oxidase
VINDKNQSIVIIGAGPAGLTAARELQAAGFTQITVIEADKQVGGISRTVNYKGNRIDIGGHRFFSKSDWVMQWWSGVLPVQSSASTGTLNLRYQGQQRNHLPKVPTALASDEEVMLVRSRLSRIYYNKHFFDYPLKLNLDALRKLGLKKTITFGLSYVFSRLAPIKSEKSLQDFLINRFGDKLYRQFFKEYTEKVWGVPCNEISAEWGAQRIKSLSILSAIGHAIKQALGLGGRASQTSLIESFIYPKYGPGQMWETVARQFVSAGGTLVMQERVLGFDMAEGRVTAVSTADADGHVVKYTCQVAISTMPINELTQALPAAWSPAAREIAKGLEYRDFITVGLLYDQSALTQPLEDNWIYIQEPGVQVGRVQVFNNWSPFMVAKAGTVWMGLEFFCRATDDLWNLSDEAMKALAQKEMHKIGLVTLPQATDAVVIRIPKAYPGYFGEAYARFGELRAELDKIPNLFLVGRNGMHRYNNQDHSMLTAKRAVELIAAGETQKDSIWDINLDDEYHEEKK